MQENIFSKLGMKDTTFKPELRDDGYLDRKMEHATRKPITGELQPGGGHHLLALPAKDCIGGMGIYSTPDDLTKVLKEVLAGGGNIIKRESVAEMLKPQIEGETHSAFMEVIDGRAKYHLRQTWPDGYDGTFGLSSSINVDDFPGRRLKYSMNWAGSAGLHAVSLCPLDLKSVYPKCRNGSDTDSYSGLIPHLELEGFLLHNSLLQVTKCSLSAC